MTTGAGAIISDDLVQSYRRQGFVHVPGLISPRAAEEYRLAALTASERLQSFHDGPVFTQLVNVWRDDETLRRLTLLPRLGRIARRLAGVPLRLWHDHVLIKQPHNNAPTEFHQDQPFWPFASARHTLSAWIALVDVPVERGCMTFIPGSHARTDLRPQNLQDANDLYSLWPDLRYVPRVTVPLRAGDCTFHHGYCAHMAFPNTTDEPRVAHVVIFMDAETTYAPKDHPVTNALELDPGQRLDAKLFPEVGA